MAAIFDEKAAEIISLLRRQLIDAERELVEDIRRYETEWLQRRADRIKQHEHETRALRTQFEVICRLSSELSLPKQIVILE